MCRSWVSTANTYCSTLNIKVHPRLDIIIPPTIPVKPTSYIGQRRIITRLLPAILHPTPGQVGGRLVTAGTKYGAGSGWTDIQCWADVYGRWGGVCKDESSEYSEGAQGE
jgi:hypothetical protein